MDSNYFKVDVGGLPLVVEPVDPPVKFQVDDPKALEFLNENGFVVFTKVATNEEINHLHTLFWDNMEIESEGRIERDDMSTWENYNWQGYVKAGINGALGLPQSKFMWQARGLPTVRRLYQTLWEGNQDMLVSMDACGAFRPPEHNDRWRTQRGWFHVDQNGYVKKGRHSIQGFLNLIDNGPLDGGLVVVRKSPSVFEQLFKKHKTLCEFYGPDYAELNSSSLIELWESGDADMKPIKICADKGDFVCWDSRTVHCNHPAHDAPVRGAAYLRRLVAYICMTPTSSISEEMMRKLAENRAQLFQPYFSPSFLVWLPR
eukprot:TRINITY_DN6204_c0_g1_i1.p1 TRINITY_DN6204_c0_g1~~TRINITY_DN6204_c0_g1_i1.p1  ORF type:complete len:316 (-),score=24.34 TRINITY_DN6204_c0_g1_i1:164-1111(-)